MIRVLLRKSVGDAKILFLALAGLMLIFPAVFLWASGKISVPAFAEFMANALPPEWQRIWGMPISQVATPAGRAALVFVHPIITTSAVVWAITRGSDCVSGEIGRGTMEMLLAQPVRRLALYGTQALTTILGSALLAFAVWCGTTVGLHVAPLYHGVPARLYVPPSIGLFGLMVCVGGISAFASSWDNQRWRTVGIVSAVYIISATLAVFGNVAESWNWINYLSFMSAYKPQIMVALPDEAWSLMAYRDVAAGGTSIGFGGLQLVLLGLGAAFYGAGAIIFCRREIPAPV
jgi:ABC-2 type transport system permease protein